jgi:hypothetical protein
MKSNGANNIISFFVKRHEETPTIMSSAANVADVADKILRQQFDLLSAPAAKAATKVVQVAATKAAEVAAPAAAGISGGGIRVEHIGIGLTLTALLILLIVVTQRATNKNSKRE